MPQLLELPQCALQDFWNHQDLTLEHDGTDRSFLAQDTFSPECDMSNKLKIIFHYIVQHTNLCNHVHG